MKFYLSMEEWYPVLELIEDNDDGSIEVPQELYDRYLRVNEEFNQLQDDLRALKKKIEEGE